eukprot:TRINITY_DN2175_c0_g1_i1.p1 TRINITY_DN2175_c0_g1~~TRINITY_DN2175_c0_g1_i1.p1  ORF type:complete len:417 (-),score=72.33 TRINITY_DN2175_c0_g1_i1:19-1245(-)
MEDPLYDPLLPTSSDKRSNLFNVVYLGSAFSVLFIAFNTMQGFESTGNKDLGMWSLFTLYAAFSVCNLFANVIVQRVGEKLCLVIGAATYVAYLGANLYPRMYTLIPASVLIGWGASILWTAQGSYLAKNSTNETMGFHSGVFFGLFMLNAVIGNLMAGTLTYFHESTTVLVWILFAIGVIATISFFFLPRPFAIVEVTNVNSPPATKSLASQLTDTLFLFGELKMILMGIVIVYSGFSQAYFYGRFPPTFGEKWLFWVMATFGFSDSAGSVLMGRLSDLLGRKPVMIVATICGLIAYVLAGWFSDPERPWLFFVIMALFGLSDSGYNTQLYATMSIYQPEKIEAAYSFLKLIQAATTAIAFLFSLYLDLKWITVIIGSSMVVAIGSFLISDLFVQKTDAPKPSLEVQ